jgi:hypothetical protein
MRGEIVVFKSGFRSRSYCLSECAQVCALQEQAKADAKLSAAAAATASSSSSIDSRGIAVQP